MKSENESSHSLYAIKKNSSDAERPCKDYHLLSHFKAHQEESDSTDPAAESMTRKETGNEVVAKQPRWVLPILKEFSLLYLHIGPSEKCGSYPNSLRVDSERL